ncbi:MAG: hypothetical protein AAF297_09310 [Planctomycetota bacterium]
MGPQRPGANFVVGCLAVLGVLVVLVVLAGVIFGPRLLPMLQGAGAEAFRAGGTAVINETDLPADEKPEMIGHIDRVADGLKDGTISFDQFGVLAENLFEDTIFWVGIVYAIDTGYVQASGLSDEEKAAGQTQLRRFAQGIHEGTIERTKLNDVAAPIGSNDADGDFSLNEKAGVTDDQLRQVIANAERVADEFGVPSEPALIDLSDEFGRVIDDSLGITADASADDVDTTGSSGAESQTPAEAP